MEVSGRGAAIGLLADMFLGTFPAGAAIGALAKNLFAPDAKDMSKIYDPKRATRGVETASMGDLKGMGTGLFGTLHGILNAVEQAFAGTGQPQPEVKSAGKTGTTRKGAQKSGPKDDKEAQRTTRPRVDPEATRQAQSDNGGFWGKALLWGGVALAGLSLLNNFSFFGGFGVPFFGGGMPIMNDGPGYWFPGLNF